MSGILLARRAGGFKTGIALPNIGDAWLGGFYTGLMDPTQAGAVPANDANQGGKPYALIDLGASAENSSVQYKTTNDSAPAACSTVWDGLGATQAMISAGSAYPAAQYAAGVTVPSDGASQAYIPAMWEMLALYWQFKPYTNSNYLTATTGSTFPGGSVTQGYNPVASPQRPAFTSSVPGQTALTAWRTGGAQALRNSFYWTATEHSSGSGWVFNADTGTPGRLGGATKAGNSGPVRMVRRIEL